MPAANYGTLKTDVEGLLWDKQKGQVPTFINAARRELEKAHDWRLSLEEIATRVIVDGKSEYTLPTGFRSFVEVQLRLASDNDKLVTPMIRVWPPQKFFRIISIQNIKDVVEAFVPLRWVRLSDEGVPVIYTEFRGTFHVFPEPNANAASKYIFYLLYLIRGGHTVYTSDGQSDWFLLNTYDALKWGAVIQGSAYLRDMELAQFIQGYYDTALRHAISEDVAAEMSGKSLNMGV